MNPIVKHLIEGKRVYVEGSKLTDAERAGLLKGNANEGSNKHRAARKRMLKAKLSEIDSILREYGIAPEKFHEAMSGNMQLPVFHDCGVQLPVFHGRGDGHGHYGRIYCTWREMDGSVKLDTYSFEDVDDPKKYQKMAAEINDVLYSAAETYDPFDL